MVKEAKKYTVTKLAAGRFVGVAEASRGLRVSRQSIYMVLGGYERALGPRKRARLAIVDASK